MCMCSTSLFFDSKGNIASRNVGVTFSLHEAEWHRVEGVENDFESFQICPNWQEHAATTELVDRHARVLRHGQRVAAGCGTAVIMRISKSKFVAGCQCVKRLYWQVHEPELAAEPDAADQAIMQQGHEVGMLARQLFPGGVEVRSDRGLDEAIRATRELVANREIPAIFEGVFEHGGVLVRVDVLHRRRDGRWRLIEVKSTH